MFKNHGLMMIVKKLSPNGKKCFTTYETILPHTMWNSYAYTEPKLVVQWDKPNAPPGKILYLKLTLILIHGKYGTCYIKFREKILHNQLNTSK